MEIEIAGRKTKITEIMYLTLEQVTRQLTF